MDKTRKRLLEPFDHDLPPSFLFRPHCFYFPLIYLRILQILFCLRKVVGEPIFAALF